MFNKTIRSALSLALVCCLVLGLCGNALAVDVPGGATVTNGFNAMISRLETAIGNLENQIAEHEKTLDDGEAKLEEGKAKLEEGEAKLQELKDLLAEVENAITEEGGYQDQLDAAVEELAALKAQLEIFESDALKADIEAAEAAQKAAQEQLDEALIVVADAEEAIAAVEPEIEEAKAVIADAEAVIADARPAIAQAKETIAEAQEIIDLLEQDYADLQETINNPKANAAYAKDLITNMGYDAKELWNAVKAMQDSLEALQEAYAPLENKVLAYDGYDYQHDAVYYELPNGDVYEYPEVNIHVDGFSYDMPELPASVAKLEGYMDTVISYTLTAYNAARHCWLVAKEELGLDIEISLETIQMLNRANLKKVYNWLYENPDKVCAFVKEYGMYAMDLLAKYGPYALDLLQQHSDLIIKVLKVAGGIAYVGAEYAYIHSGTIMGYAGKAVDFLMQYKGDVMNVVRKLYAKYGDEAIALAKVYVEYLGLDDRYYEAIEADYTIYHDSLYVAIGDETAVGGYVENLGELLEISHAVENLAQNGLSVGDAIELVGEKAELIAEADLISLGFGNLTASLELLNAMNGEQTTNWTGAVGATVTNAINSALDALYNRLTADGYNASVAEQIVAAASAYAFAYAARALQYPMLVKAIREINPDAQIVIVGTYNDLNNVVETIGGREVNIGTIAAMLVHSANLENLLQAMFCENVLYVSAYEVETIGQPTNILGYMMSAVDGELLPSEAGHAYIAEQIFNALNVEYKILGDVNGDRQVNCRDARLIIQYAADLIAADELDLTYADVDGNGLVNVRDARLIIQYSAELIEHFPACGLYE